MTFVQKKKLTREELEARAKMAIWVLGFIFILGYGIYQFLPPGEVKYQGTEKIKSFLLDIRLKPEEVLFSETIDIVSDKKDFKYGIQRSYPLFPAKGIKADYKVKGVFKEGYPVEYNAVELEKYKIYKVKAVEPEKQILPAGSHNYNIQFAAGNIFKKTREDDKLYWPVSGLYWMVPVERAMVQIFLPPALNPNAVKFEAYTLSSATGKFDQTNVIIKTTSIDNQTVLQAYTQQTLPPKVALVFELSIPKGFVSDITQGEVKTGEALKVSDDGVVTQSGGKIEEGKTVSVIPSPSEVPASPKPEVKEGGTIIISEEGGTVKGD